MTHEFRQITKRRFNEQVKMIGHQYVAVEFYSVDVHGLVHKQKKTVSISIITVDVMLFIAAASYVIYCIRVLDAKGPDHVQKYGISMLFCQSSRIDPKCIRG
jgi:hypothetical protein